MVEGEGGREGGPQEASLKVGNGGARETRWRGEGGGGGGGGEREGAR